MMADGTERGFHSEECNRADWRSTLRYAATAKRRSKRDIVRLLTLRKRVGTAFGTARLVELALSADDALLFRSVRPFHHRGDGEAVGLVGLHFIGALAGHQGGTVGRFLRHAEAFYAMRRRFSPLFDASIPTRPTSQPCTASRARRWRALPSIAVFIDEFEFHLAQMEV
jgi:hypothetical protein